ncbi:MAG: sensor histidine kinase [Minisyncoccota bacterium]
MYTKGGIFDPSVDSRDSHMLTQEIIDTIHEPLIVLDENLRVLVAGRSFYKKFDLSYGTVHGKKFYDLKDGEWNIPTLRTLLEEVIPKHKKIEGYEIIHDTPFLGRRIMLINAREIIQGGGKIKRMLISIFDITERRALEAERERLLSQKDLLLKEMRHRIANSLQLIASILILKAETVDSEESRAHLKDAHERIMSIATVQQQLDPGPHGNDIVVADYLTALCNSLAQSMIGGRKPITLRVDAGHWLISSEKAISLGLLTTELVINALKHAFPDNQRGEVVIRYTTNKNHGWTLSVSDNGVGQSKNKKTRTHGLGTSIVGAIANQLHATIKTKSSPLGTKVSIIHSKA